jgi:hypothetical protein
VASVTRNRPAQSHARRSGRDVDVKASGSYQPGTTPLFDISADGKTLTVTSKGTDAKGQKVDDLFVFEKA